MIGEDQISKIQKLLCKCGNLISMYSNLNILSLKNLIKLENYKFSYKLCNNSLPEKIMTCATTDHKGLSLKKTHRYLTRNKAVPNTPSAKCSKYLKSIFCDRIRDRMQKAFVENVICHEKLKCKRMPSEQCNSLSHIVKPASF